MIHLLNEVIQKKDWKEKKHLRSVVTDTINFKKYKTNLKKLKTIFTKLNHGKFKSTLIFDYDSIKAESKRFSYLDNIILRLLRSLGYEVSEESYWLGFAKKGDKTFLIKNILETVQNKNIIAMKKAWDKTGDDKIMKQVEAIQHFREDLDDADGMDLESSHVYVIADEKKYKIVLSMQPRLIASQSTEVGWTSCMNLYEGSNAHYVGSGIAEGVVVAYLVKNNDVQFLNSPSARVLLKPFKNENNEIIWEVDKIYGTAPSSFADKVLKIFEPFNSKEAGAYNLSSKVYADNVGSEKIVLSDEQKRMIAENDFKNADEEPMFFINYALQQANKYQIIKYLKNPEERLKQEAMRAYIRSEEKVDIVEFAKMFKNIKSSPLLAARFMQICCRDFDTAKEFIEFYGGLDKVVQVKNILDNAINLRTKEDSKKMTRYILDFIDTQDKYNSTLKFLAIDIYYYFREVANDKEFEKAFSLVYNTFDENRLISGLVGRNPKNPLITKLILKLDKVSLDTYWARELQQKNPETFKKIKQHFEKA